MIKTVNLQQSDKIARKQEQALEKLSCIIYIFLHVATGSII